jgi:hypothetical protein
MAPPPGGPPDVKPPVVVATRPESLAVLPGFTGDVQFIFDETVSEGTSPNFGLGTGDLERLVLLSPVSAQPVVRWHRGMISVHPKEGWKPGRVYRAELLPGLADLRRNQMKTGDVVTFTTGAPLPSAVLTGTVVDWAGGRAGRNAALSAVLEPDSLAYSSAADSTGRFTFGPLPAGTYVLYAWGDQNRDRKRQYREIWDSVRVVAGRDTSHVPVLWMAQRDTVGPRLTPPQVQDSESVILTFNQPIDPLQPFDSVRVRVVALPDSTPVPVTALRTRALDDTLRARAKALADSLRADSLAKLRPDSAKKKPAAPPPAPVIPAGPGRRQAVDSAMLKLIASRPPLPDRLVLRLGAPLVPAGKYYVTIAGVRNANHVAGSSGIGFQVAKAPPKPATDTTRTPADSAHAGADSLPPAPPPPTKP